MQDLKGKFEIKTDEDSGKFLEALSFFERIFWPDGIQCPYCDNCERANGKFWKTDASRKLEEWRCKKCDKRFTIRVGTFRQQSKLPLAWWKEMFTWWLIDCDTGIDQYFCTYHQEKLGISYPTALLIKRKFDICSLRDGNLSGYSKHKKINDKTLSMVLEYRKQLLLEIGYELREIEEMPPL